MHEAGGPRLGESLSKHADMDSQAPALRVGAEVGIFHRIHLELRCNMDEWNSSSPQSPLLPLSWSLAPPLSPLPKREPSDSASTG